jgi:hypothetical protein
MHDTRNPARTVWRWAIMGSLFPHWKGLHMTSPPKVFCYRETGITSNWKLIPKFRLFSVRTWAAFVLWQGCCLTCCKGEQCGPVSLSWSTDPKFTAVSGPCTALSSKLVEYRTMHLFLVSTWALCLTFEDVMGTYRKGSKSARITEYVSEAVISKLKPSDWEEGRVKTPQAERTPIQRPENESWYVRK